MAMQLWRGISGFILSSNLHLFKVSMIKIPFCHSNSLYSKDEIKKMIGIAGGKWPVSENEPYSTEPYNIFNNLSWWSVLLHHKSMVPLEMTKM